MRKYLLSGLVLLFLVLSTVSGMRVDPTVAEYSTYLDSTYQVIAYRPDIINGGFETHLGTAVMVKYEGVDYVVTAGHVCYSAPDAPMTFELMTKDGRVLGTSVRKIDPKHDLCVLNTTMLLPGSGLTLYDDYIDFGDTVRSIGSPLGIYPTPTHGEYMGHQGDLLAASIPATSGCSGAGLFFRGKVIGIIVMATRDFNQVTLAVPVSVLKEFLKSL